MRLTLLVWRIDSEPDEVLFLRVRIPKRLEGFSKLFKTGQKVQYLTSFDCHSIRSHLCNLIYNLICTLIYNKPPSI